MLDAVKKALGITTDYQDNTLQQYINEVIQYLLDAGVSKTILNSTEAYGVIIRGVSDLWNYGSGGTDLSPYFIQRAIQLKYKSQEESSESEVSLVKTTFSYVTEANQSEFGFNGLYDIIEVIVNNLILSPSAYTIGDNMVTLNVPLSAGQNVDIVLLDIAKGE